MANGKLSNKIETKPHSFSECVDENHFHKKEEKKKFTAITSNFKDITKTPTRIIYSEYDLEYINYLDDGIDSIDF